MARPYRFREIEREYNEPLESLILRLLNEKKTIPAVARHIGISERNLFVWVQKQGFEKEIRWVKGIAPVVNPES